MTHTPKQITLPISGETFTLKHTRRRDFADIPEVQPIYRLAIDRIMANSGDSEMRTKTDARMRADQRAMLERESYVEAALLARVLDPPIWTVAEMGTPPDGARDARDFVDFDLDYAQQRIIEHMCGADVLAARLEADRIARFRDEPGDGQHEAEPDGGGETQRDQAERDDGGGRPRGCAGVGPGAGDDGAAGPCPPAGHDHQAE